MKAKYDCAIDLSTGAIHYFSKNYHDLEKNLHYEFTYNLETGDLNEITVYNPTNYVDTDNRTILPHQVGASKNDYNFDWVGFEYYKKSEPVLPK